MRDVKENDFKACKKEDIEGHWDGEICAVLREERRLFGDGSLRTGDGWNGLGGERRDWVFWQRKSFER